jgi:PAS domain-containing protein
MKHVHIIIADSTAPIRRITNRFDRECVILDIRKLENHVLTAALDSFSTGVVVVGDRGRILYASDSARTMFSAADPVSDSAGFLKAHNPDAHRELVNAIAVAQRNEAAIGAAGTGVALSASGGKPTIAHVLPLTAVESVQAYDSIQGIWVGGKYLLPRRPGSGSAVAGTKGRLVGRWMGGASR